MKAWLYQIPAILLFAVILIGGIFAWVSGSYKRGGVGFLVFYIVFMLAVIACFFVGKYYDKRS